MKTIIHPTYFPNIEFFSNLLKSKNLIFEINDFYQKQTYRNRASIYGSNGKLKLIIPVSFSSSKKEKLKDIRICNNSNWQKNLIKPYSQVFETEYGFISNLSIIDLIFNEGLNSVNYFNKTNM